MQEQNFEKQVQDTLRELSLTPSVPVWQKVEQEIRQKKKRRRVIVIWFFAVLLIGSGVFGILYSTNSSSITGSQETSSLSATSNPAQQPRTHSTQNTPTTTTVTRDNTAEITSNTATQNNAAPATNNHKETVATPVTEKGSVKEKQPLAINAPEPKTRKKLNRTSQIQKTTASRANKNKTEKAPSTDTEEPVIAITTKPASIEEQTGSVDQTDTGRPLDTISTSTAVALPLAKPEEGIPSQDSVQSKKGEKKTPKWSWAVQGGYGISSLQQDFLSKAMAAPESYSDPLSNSGFPTTPTQNFSSASIMEKGAAFHIALSAKRHLNKRFSLTTALQYSYFSTKNKIGQTVERDTILVRAERMNNVSLNQYFRASQSGPLKEYTNNYHFIELPIGIEWQLHKRLPLQLQTGVSLSYLMATNALVFDPTAGIYYKNNDQFRKAQLHTYSGLTYRVWRHKRVGIHVGPYLQFGVSNLQKENTNRHLFATGLKTQVTF